MPPLEDILTYLEWHAGRQRSEVLVPRRLVARAAEEIRRLRKELAAAGIKPTRREPETIAIVECK